MFDLDNLLAYQDLLLTRLDEYCTRCGNKTLEKAGSARAPKLHCTKCGLIIKLKTDANEAIEIAMIFLMFAVIGFGAWILSLMAYASI